MNLIDIDTKKEFERLVEGTEQTIEHVRRITAVDVNQKSMEGTAFLEQELSRLEENKVSNFEPGFNSDAIPENKKIKTKAGELSDRKTIIEKEFKVSKQ